MSDFGLGGSIGMLSDGGVGGVNRRNTLLYLEPSFQIRMFVAANVALSFTAGIVIGAIDAPLRPLRRVRVWRSGT